MENNQSPFEQWQRPDGAAGSNPEGTTPQPPQGSPSSPHAGQYGGGFNAPPSGQFAPPPPGAPGGAPAPSSAYNPYGTPAANVGMPTPNEPPKKKSKAGLIAGVAAVVALGAGGVFFVTSSRANAGGADSPEALASQFLDAIDNEDVLGVVDTLLPGERDVARQPLIDFVNELTRLEVLAPVDLASVKGVDFTVQERTIVPQPTNVSDITNVAVSGEMEVATSGADIPIGKLIEDNVPADVIDEMRRSASTQQQSFGFEITTVQQDGRWYFSLGYTVAELARHESGDPDIPETGITVKGGATPEEALQLTLDSIGDFDVRGFLGSLNPGEFGALQRYSPMFIDELQDGIDEGSSEAGARLTFTTPQVRTEIDGDVASVFVDSMGVEGEIQGLPFELSFDGECVHGEMDGQSFDECGSSIDASDLSMIYDEVPELEELVNDVTEAFSDIKPAGIRFQRTNGEWFMSPFGTGTQAMLTVLRALDATELQEIIDDVRELTAVFEEEFAELGDLVPNLPDQDMPFPDDDSWGDDSYSDDSWGDDSYSDDSYSDDSYSDDSWSDDYSTADSYSDDSENSYSDDSFSDTVDTATADAIGSDTAVDDDSIDAQWDAIYAAIEACSTAPSFEESQICYEAGVSDGTIPETFMPVDFRFPDCGEPFYNARTLSDADFTAALTVAVDCFQVHVEAGEVAETELPMFVQLPECLEGKNIYTAQTDSEYIDRVTECWFAEE